MTKLAAIAAALDADTAEEFLERLETAGFSVEPIPKNTVNIIQEPKIRYVPVPVSAPRWSPMRYR